MTSAPHRPTIVLAALAVVLLLIAASCSSGGGWPVERTAGFRLQQASIVAIAARAAGPQRPCPVMTTAQLVEALGSPGVALKHRRVQHQRSGQLGDFDGVGCDWTFIVGSHATHQLLVHVALGWIERGFGDLVSSVGAESLQDGTYRISSPALTTIDGPIGLTPIDPHVVVFFSWQSVDTRTGKPLPNPSVRRDDVTLHDTLVGLRQRIVHNAKP